MASLGGSRARDYGSDEDDDYVASIPAAQSSLAHFSSDQQQELQEVFQLFDQQERGKMNCSDLKIAFRVLGVEITREQYQAFTAIYSTDAKFFNRSEFYEIAAEVLPKHNAEDKEKMLEEAYHLFDTTKAGVITAKQLSRVLNQLDTYTKMSEAGDMELETDEELQAMLTDLDVQDVGMSKAEFLTLLMPSASIM